MMSDLVMLALLATAFVAAAAYVIACAHLIRPLPPQGP